MIIQDLDWAAGLFEGEGSVFTVGKQCAGAALTMIDEDIVRRFAAVIQFGKLRKRKTLKPNYKPPWEWRVASFEHVQALVAFIWHRLGVRRRQQAKRVLLLARSGKLHSRYRKIGKAKCHPDRNLCAKELCRQCYMFKWNRRKRK